MIAAAPRDRRREQRQRPDRTIAALHRPAPEGRPATPDTEMAIASAVILKEGDLFLVAEPGGGVPLADHHAFGLYYHDCRYLDGYELRIAGAAPDVLLSSSNQGYTALSQLSVPDLLLDDGTLLRREILGIKREQIIANGRLALHDLITFTNYGMDPIVLPTTLEFRAGFDDVFTVRGTRSRNRGKLDGPTWHDCVLRFAYWGADWRQRAVDIHFSVKPRSTEGSSASFRIKLDGKQTKSLLVSAMVSESRSPSKKPSTLPDDVSVSSVQAFLRRASDEWLAGESRIVSSSLALNAILDRSLRDLRVLRSSIDSQEFFAAGVPWYATLFGRDSVITAIETLAYDPGIAENTLRTLARYQGDRTDPWRDEEPGKILHELRLGEMANTGEIPHTPYYGTIDATPLFLILMGRYSQWVGNLSLFDELRPNIERALAWIADYGDVDGDGYVEYARRSGAGLVNQGWRDSADGVPRADGTLARPPIALVEVQAYVYMAKVQIAGLFRRAGDTAHAAQLDREAEELRERFNRDFWLRGKGCYALALEAGKRKVAVVSSNAGHALWAGIADSEKAKQTADRLMGGDMFSGWGIRTLSRDEVRHNPTGYHLGTVWPHDNALIANGFRRYGFAQEASRIFDGIIESAMHFPGYRLPELFMGFDRAEYGMPVSYPVACRPQAWAAGAVPYLVRTLLGLEPEGFERRLRIVNPILPSFVHHLEIHRLRVGEGRVDLRFERTPGERVAVEVLAVDGPLDVVMDLGRGKS